MSLLEIKKYPSAVLRKASKHIGRLSDEEGSLLENMTRTMYQSQGIGLAAPQVGSNIQAAVVDVGDGRIELINPEIIKKQGSEVLEEGCLSIPGINVDVRRAKKITVQFSDRRGNTKTLEAEGLLARAIQHELDHLKGRLIIDYLNPIKKFFIKRGHDLRSEAT